MNKDQKQRAMSDIEAVESALRRWDPIGVMVGEGSPLDEYHSYAPHIVSLVHRGASQLELAAHLTRLRTKTMSLPENCEVDVQTAAEILHALDKKV